VHKIFNLKNRVLGLNYWNYKNYETVNNAASVLNITLQFLTNTTGVKIALVWPSVLNHVNLWNTNEGTIKHRGTAVPVLN
jgi:hypothetical protein